MRTNAKKIPNKVDDSIGTATEQLIINTWLSILCSYYKLQINSSIQSQQHYINAILHTVDFLYQFYDLDPIYFSLLDHAIRTLEKLVSTDDQREMLAEYCDKTAVVFQTAADKTRQDTVYKQIWSNKAKEYKNKADTIKGIMPDALHEDRIMHLYRIFAEGMAHEFIRNLLMDNYRRYESRYRSCEAQSDESGLRHRRQGEIQNDERTPLLNGFSSSQ